MSDEAAIDGEPDEPFKPKPKRKKKVRETGKGGTEHTGKAAVVRDGGESLKWTSPGMNGVPDQLEFYTVEHMVAKAAELNVFMSRDEAVAILAAAFRMTEYKAPGQTPTANQLSVHRRLRSRGFTVTVVDYLRK